MKKFFLLGGVWVGICLCFLFGDSFFDELKTVEVENQPKMALDINTAIPDANFRTCLTEMVTTGSKQVWDDLSEITVTLNFTVNGTKYDSLTEESLKQITLVQCENRGITSIQGVEYLTNLWELNLYNNKISNLNFSSTTNPRLHLLHLNNVDYQTFQIDDTLSNQLMVLDASNNNLNNTIINQYIAKFPNLQRLYTDGNNLTGELDVSSLKRLQGLWAANNQLTSIKGIADKGETYTNPAGEQEAAKLEYLVVGNNKISSIDVSGNPGLLSLQLNDNQISSINLSNNIKLLQLYLHNNKITSINLSKNNSLKDLNLSGNKISNIVITSDNLKNLYLNNTEFSNLVINDSNPSKMENLDLTNSKISQSELQNVVNRFPNLKKLNVNYNELTLLDVSKLINLEILNASHNYLSNVNLSPNSKLKEVNLYYNKLSNLVLPVSCTNLTSLNISVNNLKKVGVSSCSALEVLNISSNETMSSIDLSKNTNLKNLSASFIGKLPDLSNNNNLEYLSLNASDVSSLNLSNFPNLKSVRSVDHDYIPVYGTYITVTDLLNYIPNYIKLAEYEVHDDFNYNRLYTKEEIVGELGKAAYIRIVSNGATNKNVTNFSGTQGFTGYYEVRFMKLTSSKYEVDDVNSKIDVGGDDDNTILKNLNTSWNSSVCKIEGNKLVLYYNNIKLKEFTLLRTSNPKTGDILIGVILLLAIVGGIISVFVYRKRLGNKV